MKKQTKNAGTAAAARKNETSKGTAAGKATGPKKQATESSTRNSIANQETREADNEFHGMGEKERD